MKKLNRIVMKLSESDVTKIENCEELYKKVSGKINDELEYDFILKSSHIESFFIVNLTNKDGTHTTYGDLNSLLYSPLAMVKNPSNLNILAIVEIPNYKERYNLNKCKLRTNYGCDNKLDENYVYSLILKNSFTDESEFCEVLFLYLNLNHDSSNVYSVDYLLREKLAYYGYDKYNFEYYINSFKDEYLVKIFFNALSLLFKGSTPTLSGDNLKTWYNRFQHNRIKEKFSKRY